MEPFGIGMAALAAAGLATFGAFGLAFRQRRRRLAAGASAVAVAAATTGATTAAAPRPFRSWFRPGGRAARSVAERLEALAAREAALGQRLDALAAQVAAGTGEERLQAMAGQLLALVRDKNATFDTALAGLDQLRARLRALEEIGEPAEARALVDGLARRIETVEAAQAAEAAAEARRAAQDGGGETAAGFARAVAAVETALARLGPLEARLGVAEGDGREGRAALKRLETRIEAFHGEGAALRAELAAVKAGAKIEARTEARAAAAPAEALAGELARLHARRDEDAAALDARLGALERDLAARLADLQAARAATAEAAAARLGPVESRLAAVEAAVEAADPASSLDRFGERLGSVQARLAALEGADHAAAEVAERLAELHRQKDTAIEALVGRLAPLEARLAELDPQGALDRFGERLDGVATRLALVEGAEDPVAEITARLAELHAQKDAAIAALVGRLAPIEDRLAGVEGGVARVLPLAEDDPRVALAGLKARLGALDQAQEAVAVGLEALRAGLDARAAGAEAEAAAGSAVTSAVTTALAEVVDGMTRLFARNDASLAALLAPIEDRLAAVEVRPAGTATAETAAALDPGPDPEIDPGAGAARAEARAVAARLAERAAPGAADGAGLFADRISGLEARLPRVPAGPGADPVPDAAAEPVSEPVSEAVPEPVSEPGAALVGAALIDTLRALPRVVSLHREEG